VLVTGLVILSLASFGTMAWTAHLGGLIRHTELAGVNAGTQNENGTKVDQTNEKEGKDDD